MAASYVILTGLQHPPCRITMQITQEAAGFSQVSTRECRSKSRGHSKEVTRRGFIIGIISNHVRLYSQNRATARKRKQHCGQRECELPRLGFWYVKSSIRYILRKARAFYNELCCDTYNDPTVFCDQVMGVDPYFSTPVIPPPNVH